MAVLSHFKIGVAVALALSLTGIAAHYFWMRAELAETRAAIVVLEEQARSDRAQLAVIRQRNTEAEADRQRLENVTRGLSGLPAGEACDAENPLLNEPVLLAIDRLRRHTNSR